MNGGGGTNGETVGNGGGRVVWGGIGGARGEDLEGFDEEGLEVEGWGVDFEAKGWEGGQEDAEAILVGVAESRGRFRREGG